MQDKMSTLSPKKRKKSRRRTDGVFLVDVREEYIGHRRSLEFHIREREPFLCRILPSAVMFYVHPVRHRIGTDHRIIWRILYANSALHSFWKWIFPNVRAEPSTRSSAGWTRRRKFPSAVTQLREDMPRSVEKSIVRLPNFTLWFRLTSTRGAIVPLRK